jgi:hypothetical protein
MPAPFTAAATGDSSLTTNNLQANGTLTTVGPQQMLPAAGANVRNYITSIILQNTGAVSPGNVQILDGATVLATVALPVTQVLPQVIAFPTPLRGSPNTAVNINAGTTASNTLWNIQGYSDGK